MFILPQYLEYDPTSLQNITVPEYAQALLQKLLLMETCRDYVFIFRFLECLILKIYRHQNLEKDLVLPSLYTGGLRVYDFCL